MALAVKTAEVALPEALVVAVFTPPANVPEAPLLGAMKVTITPLTGFALESVTVATSGLANALPTAVLCGVPALAEIEAGFADVLVQVKLNGVAVDGARKVRGFAVDPSNQLLNT